MSSRAFIIILLLFFLFNSCFKNDVERISSHINVTPEYAVPLGSVSTQMADYLSIYGALTPVDTAGLPDSVVVFNYEDQFYEVPDTLYQDKLEPFSFPNLQSITDPIASLMIRTNTISKIPAEVVCQTYFLDANYQVLDSLYQDGPILIPAAPTDEQGNVIGQTELWELDTYFSKEQIQNLTNVTYLQISTRLVIDPEQLVNAKYYAEQNIWVQLAAKIKLDVYLDEL